MKKEFLEHYYTASIHKGEISTLDNSAELTFDEIKELERRVVYEQPELLNHAPTKQEIEEKFPTNISFFKLETSGRYVYLHTKYTGRGNHTQDRFGNYFSHSLILQSGYPDFKAIEVFNNDSIFIKELSIEDDKNYKPHLNVVSIPVNNSNAKSSFFSFAEFINSNYNRRDFLSKIIDSLIDGKLYKQGAIIICDKKENLVNWMLSINFLFTNKLSNQISFASYISNPSKATVKLAGVTPECGISSLDQNLFTFVDTFNTNVQYQTKHEFTRQVVNIIQNVDFVKWEDLINEINEFEVNEFTTRLNAPLKYTQFKNNIHSGQLEEFKNILNDIPDKKFHELRRFTRENNPSLFYDLIVYELDKKMGSSYTSNEKLLGFKTFYERYFIEKNKFSIDYFENFAHNFLAKIKPEDRNEYAFIIISEYLPFKVTQHFFDTLLQMVDLYIESQDNFTKKSEVTRRIIGSKENYEINFEKYLNMKKVRNINDIKTEIKKTSLNINSVSRFDKHLSELTNEEKHNLFTQIFNDSFEKPFLFNKLKDYIEIIDKTFGEESKKFWSNFFDKNKTFEKHSDVTLHSLNFIKKNFISQVLQLNKNKADLIYDLLARDLMGWVEENIRESINDATELKEIEVEIDALKKRKFSFFGF